MPNVLSPRDLFSRPDNMDETVLLSKWTFLILSNAANLSQFALHGGYEQRCSETLRVNVLPLKPYDCVC